MLSKKQIKDIVSLRVKKNRKETGLYLAEGEKLVDDLIKSSAAIQKVFYTDSCKQRYSGHNTSSEEISRVEMKKISNLTNPSSVLAIVEIPEYDIEEIHFNDSLILALDFIQDPGNLGTIIRLADWFGVDTILCSEDTVDAYSPKVIQSCMGSISRVKVIYCDLTDTLSLVLQNNAIPVYGTFLEGDNIYRADLSPHGLIVMGNEGNGISGAIEKMVTHKIHIPDFAAQRGRVESLNVATATAIVLSEFRRR